MDLSDKGGKSTGGSNGQNSM
jgi:ATP-dependent RNA helicase DDX21